MAKYLTEEQIETMAEQRMDALDHRLMNDPTFTQADYDRAVADLDRRAQILHETNAR